MIKCELTGRGLEVEPKVRDYVENKIGGLEKYIPKQMRETAICHVVLLDDPNGREDNRFVCDARLSINGDTLVSQEGTINIYAAIDIVEAKLKSQLSTYKDKHVAEPRRAKMAGRLEGREAEVFEVQ